MNTESRKILITGVCGEFGTYLAKRFSDMGFIVAGTDILEREMLSSELAALLQQYWQIDLGNPTNIDSGFTQIFSQFLPDILVNNAGQKVFKELSEFTPKQIEIALNVNLLAPMMITKLWQDAWGLVDHKNIVNILISSNAAYKGYISGSVYCSSKSGLRVFGEAMIAENAGSNIQTIVVCPETFSSVSGVKRANFTAHDIFQNIYQAIQSDKSIEIPIISFKSKLRYLIQNCRHNLRWLIHGH